MVYSEQLTNCKLTYSVMPIKLVLLEMTLLCSWYNCTLAFSVMPSGLVLEVKLFFHIIFQNYRNWVGDTR